MVELAAVSAAVTAGDRAAVSSLVTEALEEGTAPADLLATMTSALEAVGRGFACGELYVPEMLIAARAMKAGMAVLEPVLAATGSPRLGRAVLGTVEGDIHDLGKNLVGMLWRGAGIDVVDLGVGVTADRFAASARESGAQLVGVSALLTTTMPAMRDVVAAVRAEGLAAKVVVGGAPVTADFANQIGADGFAPDAFAAAELARRLLEA